MTGLLLDSPKSRRLHFKVISQNPTARYGRISQAMGFLAWRDGGVPAVPPAGHLPRRHASHRARLVAKCMEHAQRDDHPACGDSRSTPPPPCVAENCLVQVSSWPREVPADGARG